ncbi:hypothetical protein C5167_002208 [Papaver somniferum]|uniref:Uncharacterized protein n=2 Tax=Papaver somniferum TaxID=3469 RepID=A0A4Y7L024_PAPSO|nr:hypothetical protein C5167_002208 [Papaver somniferum]
MRKGITKPRFKLVYQFSRKYIIIIISTVDTSLSSNCTTIKLKAWTSKSILHLADDCHEEFNI